jgi:maltooligosyltrehalose trehalohydrolase
MNVHDAGTFAVGATPQAGGATRFRVWAPKARQIELHVVEPRELLAPMVPVGQGYYEAVIDPLASGASYFYRLNGTVDRPDPASRFQPRGIHGPSSVVSPAFDWTDARWQGVRWEDYVIYEAHVGSFTHEGTFGAMIAHLDDLAALGITAIQLMPVAQFPGRRNWGYDGVHPWAPQDSYGGPEQLKRLIDACHARSLAVVLDVVYNHLGPEGNYVAEFGPYFTDRYRTPWGQAINFDGPDCAAVRQFFIGNALYWFSEFHVDSLRLDATHAIHDESPRHLLAEMADAVHALGARCGRHLYLIAESNANDPRIVRSPEAGGYGVDAQLVDDFHRAVFAIAAGARQGSYADFGSLADVAKAYGDGFVLTGRYSKYRRRDWGAEPEGIAPNRFVAFASCHDTVGNRPGGERLSALVDFETWKLVTSATLLSYCTPLVFMGDEYGETAPFHFFTSYLDSRLAKAVRRGRQAEFAAYRWTAPFANPQSPATFAASRLDRALASRDQHAVAWRFHQELLRLRRELLQCARSDTHRPRIDVVDDRGVLLDRRAEGVWIALHFGVEPFEIDPAIVSAGDWRRRFNSADCRWNGPQLALDEPAHRPVVLWPKSCLVLLRDSSRR